MGERPETPILLYSVPDRSTWNAMLFDLPTNHVLQSWEWGEFKGRYGWRAKRLAFKQGEQVVAVAQVLARRARPLPLSILYVPKGPAMDYADRALRARVFRTLVRHARKQRAIFIKIDPDVVEATGVPGDADEEIGKLGAAFTADLAAGGWRFSDDQIQFRNTVQLDLGRSEDELLAAMKQKTRYNIRLSYRQGVEVRQGSAEDLELLFRMYTETAQRDQFLIRPLDYYRHAWGTFIEAGLACPLIAQFEGEPIAAVILFTFGKRVWYMYGASRGVHRKKMPNHRLQWEAIRWAQAQGAEVYDLWGAPNEFVDSDPMWGVWRFKAGFGGRVVRHIGAWDKVLSPRWYWVYARVIPFYLNLWRKLFG